MFNSYLKIGAFLIVASLSSCSCSEKTNSLNAGFRNMGENEIFVYDSKIGKFNVGSGLLAFGNDSSTHLFFKGDFEWPETVIVKWEKPDKTIVSKTINVKSEIPKNFKRNRDEVMFNIFPDDAVKLTFIIWTGEYDTKEIDSSGKEVDYGKQ